MKFLFNNIITFYFCFTPYITYRNRHRKLIVKAFLYPHSAQFSKHCVLAGGIQRRDLSESPTICGIQLKKGKKYINSLWNRTHPHTYFALIPTIIKSFRFIVLHHKTIKYKITDIMYESISIYLVVGSICNVWLSYTLTGSLKFLLILYVCKV